MAEDLLPKKKSPAGKSRPAPGVSPQMRRLMSVTRTLGILVGGFVTLVGLMSVVGLVTSNFWARLVVALLVGVGLPAFVSDRLLKRTNARGGLGVVVDVFALILLGLALLLAGVDAVARPLLVREGDRYARSGSRGMARAVYFLGGVSPVFPDERGAAPAGSGSASAGPSASAPPAGSAGR